MTERQLISQCIKKNQKAMTLLFDKYSAVLKTTCFRIVKNEALAKDVFQDGFITIFNKLESFKGKSSLYTWMNRIMLNTALNSIRSNKLVYTSLDIHELEDHVEEDVSDDAQDYMTELDANEVMSVMSELPDKYRIVLNLFAIDGLKHSEISEELKISQALSRKIVSRARVKLMELIKVKQDETRRSRYAASK